MFILKSRFNASFLIKSITPDPPEESSQDPIPDANSSISTNDTKPKSKNTVKGSGIPVPRARRKPVHSEQPSVSKLSELGIKVRDFAYESTLPPVPTVYLQPRQIQPSVPKDVNDPNDPHYVLEEERKKKVYTFESTRKIERTPTEPVLESDLLPPPRRTFPKIKRTDAQLDLGSQSQSQQQSQTHSPTSHVQPHDITNTPSGSQPVPGLTTDSQQTEPWVDTPVVTPNGSLQWPNEPEVTDTSTVPASQLDSDSQALPVPETVSYSQMGFPQPDSSPFGRDSGTRTPLSSNHLQSPAGVHSPGLDDARHVLSTTRVSPLNPHRDSERGRGRTESRRQSSSSSPRATPLVPTSPVQPSLPHQPNGSPSPTRSPAPVHAPTSSAALTSTLPIPSTSSTPRSPSPRYNLRNKRRAESPPSTSSAHPSTRPRLSRGATIPSISATRMGVKPLATVSAKSVHAQNKASPSVVSTGRTLKRTRAATVSGATSANGGIVEEGELRRSKRRHNAS